MTKSYRSLAGVAAVIAVAANTAQGKLTLELDYSLDTNGFFDSGTANGQLARAALERAADTFTDRFLDTFTAIGDAAVVGAPQYVNDWTPRITHPGTGTEIYSVTTLNQVAANTLKVYAGGRDLPGSTIGLGGGGGSGYSYYEDPWVDNMKSRGQAGVLQTPATDYATWGGAITFDPGVTWNLSLSSPTTGQNDFLSVALHELGHLLGVGSSASFATLISGSTFTGAKSTATYGGTVTVANAGHLSPLNSTVTGSDTQQVAMSPSIVVGTRKRLTLLDWAVFDDLGWDLARPGDANADSGVNFSDLVILAQNYNASGVNVTWSEGDFNYDGQVNFTDLVALAQNYNATGPLLESSQVATLGNSFAADWAMAQSLVPEPTTLAAVALPALLLRRRR